jgi:hypothetical protein
MCFEHVLMHLSIGNVRKTILLEVKKAKIGSQSPKMEFEFNFEIKFKIILRVNRTFTRVKITRKTFKSNLGVKTHVVSYNLAVNLFLIRGNVFLTRNMILNLISTLNSNSIFGL